MSDFNSRNNRAVWFDIPVADLDRASRFYAAVLNIRIDKVEMDGFSFCVLEHEDGNGGCLVKNETEVTATAGILLYLNVEGRIRAAEAEVPKQGGEVLQSMHSIGPHGFRSIVRDCEGNRIVLHSSVDG